MPYRQIPGTTDGYYLVAVNDKGAENVADPDAAGGAISDHLIRALVRDRITDVFVWSHGWKGDVKEAFDQYDRWLAAFSACQIDRKEMLERRPDFKELHLGFHWPSLAWGDESMVSGNSFSAGAGADLESLVAFYAKELEDTPDVRAALRQLFDELRHHFAEPALTENAKSAYLALDQALALGSDGAPGEGSADRPRFDPDQAIVDELANAEFGLGGLGSTLLAPLRQLTFWTMKKRARTVGEHGLHPLLARMQNAAPGLRLHLMGHSFGCIVVSSAVLGPSNGDQLPRPIDSVVLVQGATSLWAYAATNPFQHKVAGYFNGIVADKLVAGPLVATQSRFDYALGKIYPWAAGVANQISFGQPQFGALGIHGFCGLQGAQSLTMHAGSDAYELLPGGLYNVDGSEYICRLDGLSGAHSDIAGPEVAHLIWQAALPPGEQK